MLNVSSFRGRLLPALLPLVMGAAGCAGFMDGINPQSKTLFMKVDLPKAAFDLHCDKDKLEVTELAPGSMGVTGCGKSARYQYVAGVGWVANSSGH